MRKTTSTPAAATAASADVKVAPKPKPVNIRTIHPDGFEIKGIGKGKPDNEVKLPILWKVSSITGQQKLQMTNFVIGDTQLKIALQVARKPGPFEQKDSKGKRTVPNPNKWSMLVRVQDEEMIKTLQNLDTYIKDILKEKDLLSDYKITKDDIDECYKPFLIDLGSGDYSFNTSFSASDENGAEPVRVDLMIYERDPETNEITHRLEPTNVDNIRPGDSVICQGGFDGIRIDKMSSTTSGLPKIGFKHYSSRIVIIRSADEDQADVEEDDNDFLSAITGAVPAAASAVGEKRSRDESEETSSTENSFFKRKN
jgi:hypothetical protein